MSAMPIKLFRVVIVGMLILSFANAWPAEHPLPPAALSPEEIAEVDSLVLPVPAVWKGDFDGMRERRLIRVLVPYSKTFFMVNKGRQEGISFELGKAFEAWLNKYRPYAQKSHRWHVMFIPVSSSELLPKLLDGVGDIAAGGLTVTDNRLRSVDFATPFATNINEIVVTAPGSKPFHKLEELSGQQVVVRQSSSYYEHLFDLNKTFVSKGLAPIDIQLADNNLESEDLLEMVNAGVINAIIVDSYIAKAWAKLYTGMQLHQDVVVYQGAEFAWAVRKGSPQLKEELSQFVKVHKVGTTFGNMLRNKYIRDSMPLYDSTSDEEMRRFKEMVSLFQKHAGTYSFDYLMLMAQGFQESQLNQSARSSRGAVGIMQLLPSTASDRSVAITGIDKSADKNVEAAAKYMRLLSDKYLNDPKLSQLNRTLMSFAAYNAGPGNLMKFRRLAEKSGLDSTIWFGNVEHAASRIVGRETVDYVGNIYKYYVAYKLSEAKNLQRRSLQVAPK